MTRIILASNSPRRKKILADLGLEFEVIPSNYEELNSAQAGKNILKWNDKWGEYEVEITISE